MKVKEVTEQVPEKEEQVEGVIANEGITEAQEQEQPAQEQEQLVQKQAEDRAIAALEQELRMLQEQIAESTGSKVQAKEPKYTRSSMQGGDASGPQCGDGVGSHATWARPRRI